MPKRRRTQGGSCSEHLRRCQFHGTSRRHRRPWLSPTYFKRSNRATATREAKQEWERLHRAFGASPASSLPRNLQCDQTTLRKKTTPLFSACPHTALRHPLPRTPALLPPRSFPPISSHSPASTSPPRPGTPARALAAQHAHPPLTPSRRGEGGDRQKRRSGIDAT